MSGDILDAAAALQANLAGYTQDTRLLRLTTSLGLDALLAERFSGAEGMSKCFHSEIIALSIDAAVDGQSLLGQPALLEILTQHSRSDLRPIQGISRPSNRCRRMAALRVIASGLNHG